MLINPFSGQKRAEALWAQHGAQVLLAAGIEADIIHTGRYFDISTIEFSTETSCLLPENFRVSWTCDEDHA